MACTHFYDDFAVVEPACVALHAQRALRELLALIGMPFSREKQADAATTFTFLGVESLLGEAAAGSVTLRVTQKRIDALCASMEELLADGAYPSAAAAHLCGKLQFVLSWVGGRVGRACMQPLFAPGGDVVTPAVAASLRYLIAVLPLIPPHTVALAPARPAPALVWSDGAAEEGQARLDIGFLVAIPRDSAPVPHTRLPTARELRERYAFYHGCLLYTSPSPRD